MNDAASPAPAAAQTAGAAIVSLLPAQRRQHIIEFLRRHGAVTLTQLE